MNIITKLKQIRKNAERVFQSLADDGFSRADIASGRSQSVSMGCREIGIWANFDNLNHFLMQPIVIRINSRKLSRLAMAARKQDRLVHLCDLRLNNYSDLRKVKFL